MSKNVIELWLVRHGETIFNRKNLVQGWSDSPLTHDGIITTLCLAKGLKEHNIVFEKAYSSDLTRCIDTSNILINALDKDTDLHLDKRLREINTGDGEGDFISEHLTKYPYSLNFKKHPGTPNGENWNDVFERFIPAIYDIARTNEKGKILVVSHSMVIASLVAYIDRSIEEVMKIPNNSVTIFEYVENDLRIKKVGDTQYIDKGMQFYNEIKSSYAC
jgi:phosphoglycerate mutase